MKFEMTSYISNFNKLLVNYGEHIFLQLKIYQVIFLNTKIKLKNKYLQLYNILPLVRSKEV